VFCIVVIPWHPIMIEKSKKLAAIFFEPLPVLDDRLALKVALAKALVKAIDR